MRVIHHTPVVVLALANRKSTCARSVARVAGGRFLRMAVATGAGHHSVLQAGDQWYIVYHRRPLGEKDRNHRVVSIDELHFDEQGFIQPVVITKTGVERNPVR